MTLAETRRVNPWPVRERIGRLCWSVVQSTLFRFSPRPFYSWRNWLLRRFGATIHRTAHVHGTVKIEVPWHLSIGAYSSIGDAAILYSLGNIRIGDRVTISQYAHLCAGTHDYALPSLPLLKLPITIEDDVWIATDAFIGPNVTIRESTIVGARAVVVKDTDSGVVLVGNPARVIKRRGESREHG